MPLEGAVNFRDLGGYATEDGRVTAWHRLYRSDALTRLSEPDLARVAALGLRTIYDLRGETERSERPNRLPTSNGGDEPRVRSLGFLSQGAEWIMRQAKAGDLDTAQARAAIEDLYRGFPLAYGDVCRRIAIDLGNPARLPALIHCTSGKDRTGFVIAMLLRALGVSRKTVLEDYLITDRYRHDLSDMLHPGLAADTVETVLAARSEYLNLAFAAIDQRWGSDEVYLRDGLGLAAAEHQALRSRLLAD
ncbi:MAG: tyrosine-protein phosphatase [Salinisphaera sp.]|nr:tyrosine-protein phosphatase [Salinisphaera sp.]